ncbi:hypothetical protein BDN72DRAFT_845604 [Pluteus cervinus]|uniref:Uncharacterized protein n=1 Tax=Pluteus cervinus TaxID=181527 RepID=A0ACD3AJ15_9AGAR|nr:hypothetical protein BDN72DRAFT_845604 [Pluteus cervinus]
MPGSSLERSSDANRLSEASGSAQHNPSEPVQELTPQQMNVDSQMVSVHSSQSDQTLELNEADFTPNLSIPEACLLAGIPSKTLENARFLPATRTTPCFQVFMNFKHLQTILRTFELAEPRSSRTFAGGFRITLGGILQHLDWNIFSYQKKYTAFLWGEKVCRATWKGPVPAKGDPEHILYTRWRGIVWYFRDGGGLDSEVPPRAENKNRRGVDPDESAAAQLRQVMLFGERGVLDDFLAFY